MNKLTIDKLLKENPDLTMSETVKELLKKLDYYQNLEENGMLFKTPCKIFQKIYTIQSDEIEEYTVVGFSFVGDWYSTFGSMTIWLEYDFNGKTYSRNIESDKIGVDWFLTEDQAQEKLLELKEKNNDRS